MISHMKDLIHGAIHVDDQRCAVKEVFFDPDSRQVRYLAVDIGGWFDTDEILVSAELLEPPTGDHKDWRLGVDEDALSQAPRWHEDMESAGFDLRAWPPVFVGPFGGTYSPILMYEQLEAEARRSDEPGTSEQTRGDKLVFRMERATEWLGLPAFGRDGELGKVDDILFDGADWHLTGLILSQGSLMRQRSGEVPIAAVRHRADQGTHLVLDLSSSEVADTDSRPAG